MKATEANYKDIQKYYQGTYIVCPEYNPTAALYVEAVSPTGIRVQQVDGDKGFIEVPYQLHNPLTLRRQYYQAGNKTFFISRIPARMWKKGLSHENTNIQQIQSNGTLSGNKVAFQNVTEFFTNKDVFPTTLPEDMDSYGYAIALSPHWMLHLGSSNTLFLLNSQVAKLSFAKKRITMLKEFSKIPLPMALKDWTCAYV